LLRHEQNGGKKAEDPIPIPVQIPDAQIKGEWECEGGGAWKSAKKETEIENLKLLESE